MATAVVSIHNFSIVLGGCGGNDWEDNGIIIIIVALNNSPRRVIRGRT